jgi:hypothetical protein
MTDQEIFDTVVTGLRKQKCKSVGQASDAPEVIQCKYRSPEGYKCAAGQLIPDDKYNPALEGQTVLQLEQFFVQVVGLESPNQIAFLSILQSVHDKCEPCDWEINFTEVAKIHNLIYTSLLEVGDAS